MQPTVVVTPPPAFQPPVADPFLESTFTRTLRNIFGLDLRSLACFRIGVSLVVLWDLQDRAWDLRAHYTGDGILPLANDPLNIVLPFSLHNLCDNITYQAALFLLHAAAAVALLVGYRTRLMTLVVWALLLSVQARNPLILHAGDELMRVTLFWGMFLPLGAIWSVDAARSGRPRPPSSVVVSPATVAFILQMCFVYFFAFLWKTDPAWRSEFTAVHEVLHLDFFATRLGLVTRQYPELLKVLTMMTMFIEGFGPILVLSPILTQRIRLLAVLLFMSMHIGIGLNIELGNFVPICLAAWTTLLPSWFWDRLRFWQFTRWPAAVPNALPPRRLSDIETALICFCLAYVFFLNVRGIYFKELPQGQLPDPFFHDRTTHLGITTGLQQGWGVFAPAPRKGKSYGWYIVKARLKDGSVVDLHNHGEPITLEKPALVSATFINSRWRRYLNNLDDDNNIVVIEHRHLFVSYLEREWNASHPDRKVVLASLLFLKQNPHPDGGEDITYWQLATVRGIPLRRQLSAKEVTE